MPASPQHPAFVAGKVAVITGGASGIGLAAARRMAAMGLHILLADLVPETLEAAAAVVSQSAGGKARVETSVCDVADFNQVQALAGRAEALGVVSVLMNNAGAGRGAPSSWEGLDQWRSLLATNLWGVIHGVHAFAPGMIGRAEPAVIINTGSKQGITLPPGNPAYNLSKAGVRAFTETLAYELRAVAGGAISSHLLIPGFTHTGMTARDGGKDPLSWTADQVVDFMLEQLAAGTFYILCPDNAVPRELDEKRMQWMIDDIIRNRPALSRWHPDYEQAFAEFIAN